MKKLLQLFVAAFCCLSAQAQDLKEWALVEPQSGRTVLMTDVGFLLASDADDTFAVVCKDGSIIDGARSVGFMQVDPSAIASPRLDGAETRPFGLVDGRLTLTGCPAGTKITVFDGAGRAVRTVTCDGRQTTVDVAGLATGVYVLMAGDVTVKFMKR